MALPSPIVRIEPIKRLEEQSLPLGVAGLNVLLNLTASLATARSAVAKVFASAMITASLFPSAQLNSFAMFARIPLPISCTFQ
jgi:hypothetical protein